MRFKIQTTVLLFVLLGTVSACNTFKDEIAPDSYMEVPKQLDGKWQLKTVVRNGTDISEVMDFSQFRLIMNKDNTYNIENYLPFLDEPYRNLFRLQMMAIGKLNERIRHDEPLVEFANQVSNTDNLIDMNAMAKLAVEEDIPIGRNRLFRWLRENEILMSGNLPYQKYIDRGYFAVKESVFEMDSMCRTYQQTFVTGKGQQYIIGRLKKEFCNEI